MKAKNSIPFSGEEVAFKKYVRMYLTLQVAETTVWFTGGFALMQRVEKVKVVRTETDQGLNCLPTSFEDFFHRSLFIGM